MISTVANEQMKKKRYWHTRKRRARERKNALKHKSIENEIGTSKFQAIEKGEKWEKFVNLTCH